MRPVLITAGATRNRIDAMRFISAHASGRTGAHIARALGSGVFLLGSPEACLRAPESCATATYTDTLDLLAQMEAWVRFNPRGLVIHAAAVGDYMVDPADPAADGKRPSGQEALDLRLVPTPKIVDRIRQWSAEVFLVSFKAAPPGSEPTTLLALAAAQQTRTGSDVVFGNTIGQTEKDILIVDGSTQTVFPTREAAIEALIERISAERQA